MLLLYIFATVLDCQGKDDAKFRDMVLRNSDMQKDINSEVFTVAGHQVEIITPQGGAKADILVLPGWGFSRTKWCGETELCSLAITQGYRLILPEMFKSVYHSECYAETRTDWRKNPDRSWLLNELFPALQAKGILKSGGPNFILGLSTGARGAALICLDKPDLFKAVALLSGDFDQTLMKKDNLMKGYYGEYEKFPERWEGRDNPVKGISEWKTPVYISHGKADKVVPSEQSELLVKRLKESHPELPLRSYFPEAGHGFSFWAKEVTPALEFFREFQK